jgi:hypothetical protein
VESTDAVVGDQGRGEVALRSVSACHRYNSVRFVTVRENGVEPLNDNSQLKLMIRLGFSAQTGQKQACMKQLLGI